MYGNESVIGAGSLLWDKSLDSRTLAVRGHGYSVKASILAEFMKGSPEFRSAINRSLWLQSFIGTQLAVCGRRHEADARIARFLLMALDRTGQSMLQITQQQLADLIAVRRTTATSACILYAKDKILRTRRGVVHVLNRELLEGRACECYKACRDALARLNESYSVRAPGTSR